MADPQQSTGATPHFDLLIIGGGINGAGIARDAAGRGFSVCLCEAGDVGSGTSSASTKLVHGGLRYLEHNEFRLVREALMEREVLWRLAPHIIWPMRFVLPLHRGMRPSWLIRLGLLMYDHLGGRKLLPGTKTLDLTTDEAGKVLKREFRKAFEYSDCWVEDSRLVVLNLRDAEKRGADIRPRTKVTKAHRQDGKWQATLKDARTGKLSAVTASLIVNASGPWVDEVLKTVFGRNNPDNVRHVRGSHIVIAKKFSHQRAYIFQNTDGRVIFAIPYERDFTLIGTTDEEHGDAMTPPKITGAEIDYLCRTASAYFIEPVEKSDIVWTYSGVRPLYDDGVSKAQEATRDYVIRRDKQLGDGMLINIFGGKITTYRRLAEAMMAEIEETLGRRGKSWTGGAPLPGGDFPPTGYDRLVAEIAKEFPTIDRSLLERLVRAYGTEASKLLAGVNALADLGRHFGHGIYEAELRYLADFEWAKTGEDVLFRRTRMGIKMNAKEQAAVEDWFAEHQANAG